MIEGKKVLALVPARAGSRGLPGKNIRPFCGKPLLLWSVEHGLASSYVDNVVVSTDSREFAEIAKKGGAEVPFFRPEYLASDTAASIDVMLHAVDFLEARGDLYDILVLLEPTSPLRKPEDIDKALEALCSHPHAESIVAISLTEGQHPVFLMHKMQNDFLQSYKADFRALRRQEIPPLYFLTGTVYASFIDSLRRNRGFCHDKTLGYEVPKNQSFEIDDADDFIICEALLKARQREDHA